MWLQHPRRATAALLLSCVLRWARGHPLQSSATQKLRSVSLLLRYLATSRGNGPHALALHCTLGRRKRALCPCASDPGRVAALHALASQACRPERGVGVRRRGMWRSAMGEAAHSDAARQASNGCPALATGCHIHFCCTWPTGCTWRCQ